VSGAAGQPLTRQNPVGHWTIQLENTDELTASFQVGFIQDIVLVLTVAATARMAVSSPSCSPERMRPAGFSAAPAPLQRCS